MKLSATSLSLLVAVSTNRSAVGFAVLPVGNRGRTKAVEGEEGLSGRGLRIHELLAEVEPRQDFGSEEAPPLRNTICGTETPCMSDYWSRPDIHTFGNMGLGGAFHAVMAPIATHIIDEKAYGGVYVRKNISDELRTLVNKTDARVVDLCCGVGMSTRAIEAAFHDAEFIVGLDTSDEMISMAKAISGHEQGLRHAMWGHNEALRNLVNKLRKILNEGISAIAEAIGVCYPTSHAAARASYQLGNAENTGLPDLSFDLVTIMYGFHEVPMAGRARIINEARRILRRGGLLAIVDICPTYAPSPQMLAGEPFVKEYQKNIDSQLANFPGFTLSKREVVVPGHVNLWLLTVAEV